MDDTNVIFPRKVAIEAKDWKKSLTSEDISKIYNLYSPSIISREIDSLWIVGRIELASSPRSTINNLPGVAYTTFEGFQSSLMNFRLLITDNILEFENHDSSKNFIHSRIMDSDQTVFEYTKKWMTSDSSGLVVYGGYGVGKTSYSLFVSSYYSKEYIAGDFDRIPIRFSLGGLYTKQDLPALIRASLSGADGRPAVKEFSYALFLEMARLGKLLLILDGFDVMRHAMDIDDFAVIFEQMKPLFEGRSKVIVLGRPDSFFSDDEENRIMNSLFGGIHKGEGKIEKVEVSLLNGSEIDLYLNRYFKAQVRRRIELIIFRIKVTWNTWLLPFSVTRNLRLKCIGILIGAPIMRYFLLSQRGLSLVERIFARA
ncbi:MAG: hypothetical protein E5W70_29235 [Mesorhizobium sp.]|uniref:NACHT domain-containing protein n=1 Tax=Mesorhizobium sp. TaxID=1871066 RepID=UPI00122870EB|nr:hypothetical protein [Mesorhizobium sp.]TIT18431.1 MAG: hypothetical protein E5W70_29235 [Mesorhizobium sp.]